jgi:lactoylglutathione lyase
MTTVPRVHIHMTVPDLEKSRRFYERFLGVTPVKVKPGYVKFLPEFGPLNLVLADGQPGPGRGSVDHIGLQVDTREEVVRQLQRVQAAGLPVREEFGVDCCHANQDKFWVQDPDGVDWEVYVLNHDLEDESPAVTPSGCGLDLLKPSACCAPSTT